MAGKQPQPDRHSRFPKSVRLPGGLEARLDAYVEAAGMSASATIITALTEYLDTHAPLSPQASPEPPRALQ